MPTEQVLSPSTHCLALSPNNWQGRRLSPCPLFHSLSQKGHEREAEAGVRIAPTRLRASLPEYQDASPPPHTLGQNTVHGTLYWLSSSLYYGCFLHKDSTTGLSSQSWVQDLLPSVEGRVGLLLNVTLSTPFTFWECCKVEMPDM